MYKVETYREVYQVAWPSPVRNLVHNQEAVESELSVTGIDFVFALSLLVSAVFVPVTGLRFIFSAHLVHKIPLLKYRFVGRSFPL